MAHNFVGVDREQLFLMPPSVADWLPEDHLAWFVLDVVDEFDLSEFVAGYRSDGRGGAAYHPGLMVALLVYAYAIGERSSRTIERRCVQDVAFRVIAGNQQPDHATIARFRSTHTAALAGLFGQVLGLCVKAGLVRPGLLAIDGTTMGANASRLANKTAEQLAAEILDEAAAVDAVEDAEGRDDELPEPVRRRGADRKRKIREMLDELQAEQDAKSYEAHIARRAAHEAATGRPIGGRRPTPDSTAHRARKYANVTDPDSRLRKTHNGFVQGYNAQTVATQDQVVVAAEINTANGEASAFRPMIDTAKKNLRRAGETRRVRQVVADAGYWSKDNVNTPGIETFIAPGKARQLINIAQTDAHRTRTLERVEAGEIDAAQAATDLGIQRSRVVELLHDRHTNAPPLLTTTMITKLDSPRGRRIYRKRAASIEPVFAQIKHNRGIRRFSRRGRTAADSEWKLICATHNLLKLWRLTPA